MRINGHFSCWTESCVLDCERTVNHSGLWTEVTILLLLADIPRVVLMR